MSQQVDKALVDRGTRIKPDSWRDLRLSRRLAYALRQASRLAGIVRKQSGMHAQVAMANGAEMHNTHHTWTIPHSDSGEGKTILESSPSKLVKVFTLSLYT